MKRIFLLAAFLWLIAAQAQAQVGYFVFADCDTLAAPVDGATICTQTTTTGGRTVGHLYIRRAGAWVDVDTSGTGAPTDATYILQTANGSLSAEQVLGVLASGILKNTTTTGVLSIATQGTDYYAPGGTDVAVADGGTGRSTLTNHGVVIGAGTTGVSVTSAGTAGQVLTSNGASADPTFQSVAGVGTVTSVGTTSPITGGPITTTGSVACPTCTTSPSALTANQIVTGGGAQALQTIGSLGTTTTVLHGNAAGSPTWGAVALSTDVSGTLPVASGGTNLTTATDDNVMVGNGTTWQTKSVPTCTDTGGNHLNYDASTNTFSCGTSSSGAGSIAFSGITGATNTTAAMVVGTGATLGVSGTGTISSTAFATITTVASLGTPTAGVVAVVTDADTACDTGGGSTIRVCVGDGAGWITVGDGVGTTDIGAAFTASVDGNVSGVIEAKPLTLFGSGGGTDDGWRFYTDSTNTPVFNCVVGGVENACDYYRKLADTKKWGVQDSAGNVELEHTEDTGITAMTVDAETAGVTITLPHYWDLDLVGVVAGVANHVWNDDPLSTTCAALATVGTNRAMGVCTFPDSDGDYGKQITRALPTGWTGSFDADIWWNTTGTGNARFQIQTKCYADDEVGDAAFNTASVVTAAAGTSGRTNKQTITGITTTGCDPEELMRIRFFRNRTEGSDTLNAALNVEKVVFKLRIAH